MSKPASDIYDYSQVLRAFTDSLEALRAHFVAHDMTEGSPAKAADIAKAIHLFQLFEDAPGKWGDEKMTWEMAWDYVRDNMREWWC